MIIKHEVSSKTLPTAAESPADKTLRLATAIGKASGSDPLRPVAFDVLGELLREPNPSPNRLRDADFIAKILDVPPDQRNFNTAHHPDTRAATDFKSAGATQEFGVVPRETQRPALNKEQQNAAIAASIAVAQGGASALPVELDGPVTQPLRDAETLATLARQPGALGAAAIHDTLHPGSHN